MKDNSVSINIIIDKSGSMATVINDTIGGFNKFLADQKAIPGEASLTLCTFNTECTLVHSAIPLASVPDLCNKTYNTSGMTALLDAMGTTITSVGEKLAALSEDERPSKVVFLIITDGQENSSHKFTKDQIKSMVKLQTEVYSWDFIFMGANIDSFGEADALGITGSNTMNYAASDVGTRSLYKNISENMSNYRSTKSKVDFFEKKLTDVDQVDNKKS